MQTFAGRMIPSKKSAAKGSNIVGLVQLFIHVGIFMVKYFSFHSQLQGLENTRRELYLKHGRKIFPMTHRVRSLNLDVLKNASKVLRDTFYYVNNSVNDY
jgi:hypothetical protein